MNIRDGVRSYFAAYTSCFAAAIRIYDIFEGYLAILFLITNRAASFITDVLYPVRMRNNKYSYADQ